MPNKANFARNFRSLSLRHRPIFIFFLAFAMMGLGHIWPSLRRMGQCICIWWGLTSHNESNVKVMGNEANITHSQQLRICYGFDLVLCVCGLNNNWLAFTENTQMCLTWECSIYYYICTEYILVMFICGLGHPTTIEPPFRHNNLTLCAKRMLSIATQFRKARHFYEIFHLFFCCCFGWLPWAHGMVA